MFAIGLEVTSYENVERASAANTQNILPPSERLFSGGRDSVRGYAPRELGPIVRSPVFKIDEGTDEPGWDCTYRSSKLGGSKRTLLQMELRYRLLENIALASFVDSGNTFFSQGEMREFAAAYADSLDPGLQQATDPCFGINPARSVEDNVGYTYAELLQKPGYFFSRHYLSYGLSVNWLTPIGSVNIAYGLPWREPKTERCNNNSDLCFPRTDKNKWWFWRGELHINVGTRF